VWWLPGVFRNCEVGQGMYYCYETVRFNIILQFTSRSYKLVKEYVTVMKPRSPSHYSQKSTVGQFANPAEYSYLYNRFVCSPL